MRPRAAWPELLLALGVLVLAGVVAYQTTLIRVAPIYAKVGPRLFPGLVAVGLALAALALAVEAWRGGGRPAEEVEREPVDLRAGLVVAGGLLVQVLLYEPAGFVIASALGFVAVAYGFGSRRILRDAAVAVLLAVVVYLVFAKGLGLALPKGLLEALP